MAGLWFIMLTMVCSKYNLKDGKDESKDPILRGLRLQKAKKLGQVAFPSTSERGAQSKVCFWRWNHSCLRWEFGLGFPQPPVDQLILNPAWLWSQWVAKDYFSETHLMHRFNSSNTRWQSVYGNKFLFFSKIQLSHSSIREKAQDEAHRKWILRKGLWLEVISAKARISYIIHTRYHYMHPLTNVSLAVCPWITIT